MSLKNILLPLLFFSICYHGRSAGINDTVLVVMNVQDYFVEGCLRPEEAHDFIAVLNKVVSCFDSDDIIYVKSVLTRLAVSLRGLEVDTLPGLDFAEELDVVNQCIIDKNRANAFRNKQFADRINEIDPACIIIIGFRSGHSIYKTIMGGKNAGYNTGYIDEAVRDFREKDQQGLILKYKRKGIPGIPVEDIDFIK